MKLPTTRQAGWHEYSSSYEVDDIRMHLAFSADDSSRYAVYINLLTRQFEDVRLFLCCNILTSIKALEVLAYITALQLGNYRELDSDCLEFTKAAAKLQSWTKLLRKLYTWTAFF